jgi:hypothetical protein
MLTKEEIFDVDPGFKHLENFVNRTEEFQKFQTVTKISPRERSYNFLAFYGIAGIGKSWLMYRLHFECKRRNLTVGRLKLEDDRLNDPIRIMVELVEQLGEEKFPAWIKIKREWNSISGLLNSSGENLASGSTLNVTSTKDVTFEKDVIAGNKIETHYQISGDVKTPAQQNPEEYKHALTQSFLKDLSELLQHGSVIFLIDNFDSENLASRTREWIMENLLDKPRSAKGYGVLAVITSSRELDSSIYFDVLQSDTEFEEILPLEREHIIEYMKIKKIPENIIQREIDLLFQRTQGIPKRVFEEITLFAKVLKKMTGMDAGTL